jgi:hypothetical protein
MATDFKQREEKQQNASSYRSPKHQKQSIRPSSSSEETVAIPHLLVNELGRNRPTISPVRTPTMTTRSMGPASNIGNLKDIADIVQPPLDLGENQPKKQDSSRPTLSPTRTPTLTTRSMVPPSVVENLGSMIYTVHPRYIEPGISSTIKTRSQKTTTATATTKTASTSIVTTGISQTGKNRSNVPGVGAIAVQSATRSPLTRRA